MNLRIIHLLVVLIASTIMPLHAITPDALDSLSYAMAISDPSLEALLKTNAATIQTLQADNQLPAPEVEVDQQWGRGQAGNKFNVIISQSFDWPGLYSARAKAKDAQRAVLGLMYASRLQDRVNEIRSLLMDIAYLNQRLAVHTYVRDNTLQLLEYTRKGYENGENTILDVHRMHIGSLNIEHEVRTIQNDLRTAVSNLAHLSNGDYSGADQVARQMTDFVDWKLLPEETYTQWALENNPALKALEASKAAAELNVKAVRRGSLPGFSLGYHFSREEGETFNGFTAGMTLPFLRKNRLAKAAELNTVAATMDYDNALMKAATSIRADWLNASRLFEACQNMATVFENHDYLELLQKALKGGEIRYSEYVSDVNFFHMAQEDYLMTQYELAQALCRLNRFRP